MYDMMEEEEYEYQAVELPDELFFSPQAEFNDKPDSLFFNDGVRRIDFILVYEDEDKKDFEKRHQSQRRKVGRYSKQLSYLITFRSFFFLLSVCFAFVGPFRAQIKRTFSKERGTHDSCIQFHTTDNSLILNFRVF